ncbi:MAG: 16S rRNA (uracil(1498)-N(3))-methyltransferase [Bdellovibrionaceae bacterium]|nr:16S rRNA (uracil(1498)-N(3))-methyltransferase [Pseudobdellovibrionaceae bacterium]
MRRYWFDPTEKQGERIRLAGDLYHHVIDVCRQGEGSRFELLSEGGKAYFVELVQVAKKEAWAEIVEERQIPPLEKPHIHLAVSVPRFQRMDTIVEKSVELGVFELHPFVSDFSFVRSVDSRLTGKWPRWKKIIQGATQQSGRGDLMGLGEPQKLEDLLAEFNRRTKAVGLFPYEGEAPQHLRQALEPLKGQEAHEIWVFVGSEGGYSDREVQLFQSFGLQPVTLGSQVLRVETACLALVSILKYEWNLMK